MTDSNHRAGILLVLIGTIFWSSAGLFVRLLPLDAWTIVAWRSGFGFVIIMAFVGWRLGRRLPGTIRAMGAGGALIVLYTAGGITLYVPALQSTSVTSAMTIYAVLPFIVAGLAWAWLGERPPARTIGASVVALLGLLVMFGGPGGVGLRTGDAFAVAATLVAALMTVQIRRSRQVDMLAAAGLANLLAVLIALPLASHPLAVTTGQLVTLANFAFCAMALGMMLYLIGAALIPAASSALIGTLTVPASVLWVWVGVGEMPTPTEAVGATIVLGGVLGALLLERRAARLAAW